MTEFEAATHQLLGVIAEALDPVIGYNDESTIRLAVLQSRIEGLVHSLVIHQEFPMLADQPAKDVRKAAEGIRERISVRLAEAAERAA